MFCASATLANGDRPTYPMRSEVPTRRRGLARVWTRGEERRGEAYSPKDTMIASLRIWCDDSLLNGVLSSSRIHVPFAESPARTTAPSTNEALPIHREMEVGTSDTNQPSCSLFLDYVHEPPDNNRACSTAARLNPSRAVRCHGWDEAGGRVALASSTGPKPNASHAAETPSAWLKDSTVSTCGVAPDSIECTAAAELPMRRPTSASDHPRLSLASRARFAKPCTPRPVGAHSEPRPNASQPADTPSASAMHATVLMRHSSHEVEEMD